MWVAYTVAHLLMSCTSIAISIVFIYNVLYIFTVTIQAPSIWSSHFSKHMYIVHITMALCTLVWLTARQRYLLSASLVKIQKICGLVYTYVLHTCVLTNNSLYLHSFLWAVASGTCWNYPRLTSGATTSGSTQTLISAWTCMMFI